MSFWFIMYSKVILCIHIHTYIFFFIFFAIMIYYMMLNIVPYAI